MDRASDSTTPAQSASSPATFDRFALGLVGLLALLALLMAWRGDQAGVPIEVLSPADGALDVSVEAVIRIEFGQAMPPDPTVQLQSEPAIEGDIRWRGRTLELWPDTPLQADTEYTLSLPSGLSSESGREVRPVEWRFRTGRPKILFLGWDEADVAQIFLASQDGNDTRQLTTEARDVLNFAVSPDGGAIIYSALRPDGSNGADLWLLDADGDNRRRLLACEGASCERPAWSPAGDRLAYERRRFSDEQQSLGPSRLWWLDPNSGQTVPVFEDSQWLGLGARFSPDGKWLSYVAPLEEEVQAFHLSSGELVRINSRTGEAPTWTPDNQAMLVTDLDFFGEQFAVRIYQVDLETARGENLSGQHNTNDASAIFSPDGEWIAFNRKLSQAPMGRQLYLMRPDGSDLTQLTNNVEVHHGPPAWSPDGNTLLFQMYRLAEVGAEPGIWTLDIDSGQLTQISNRGISPAWLP